MGMKAVRLLNRVLAGLVLCMLCMLFLPLAYCQAGEREDAAVRYFTEEAAGRHYMYSFLHGKLKAGEALPEEEERARRVLDKLIKAAVSMNGDSAKAEGWQMENDALVLVTPNEKFNAYALPGGIFVVNRGVLDILSDDELAVILAHELGHQVLGHPVAAMKRSPLSCRYLRRSAKELAAEQLAEGAGAENPATVRRSVEAFWEAIQLSNVVKREEREADEWAAQLIVRSGFDIYAAVNLWPWLEELYGPVPNASNHLTYKERSRIYAAAGRNMAVNNE
ncbi:M48 family metalloprotease [Anaerovibrio sp.]|uniref:M48 family metalloprotease n=1 Tax=Anaerovibrio sp. TaxID=1872532 RepID=UPI003F185170